MSYPEHEKLKVANMPRQPGNVVKEFLEFLEANGLWICEDIGKRNNVFAPTVKNHDALIAGYLEINPITIDREKEAMIEEMRNANAKDRT